MTAITDIQRSLNAIRAIERESSIDVRLEALTLIAAVTADIAKELRGVERVPKRKNIKPPSPLPLPKPNTSTVKQQQQSQAAPQSPTIARPFTEPERAQPQE